MARFYERPFLGNTVYWKEDQGKFYEWDLSKSPNEPAWVLTSGHAVDVSRMPVFYEGDETAFLELVKSLE